MPDDGRPDREREPGAEVIPAAEAGAKRARKPIATRRARRRARNLRQALPDPRRETAEAAETLPDLPPDLRPDTTAPPTPSPDEDRAAREREIAAVQRALVRRRRVRAAALFLRLAFFVILPTVLVGHYYFSVATPMYETKTEFLIQRSEALAPGGRSGIFGGAAFGDSKDAIAVQGFLTSRAAMDRLDAEEGFVAHFSNPAIDEIQRLPAGATRSAAYDLYRRTVIVGFDLTEGILRMQVIATDRETSQRFATALIRYAEEMVDALSARAREENMRGAETSFEDREADVREAAARVLKLQKDFATFSAEGELQLDLAVIQTQTLELEKMRRDLNEMLANPRPNQAQLDVLRRDIAFTEKAIEDRRSALTDAGRSGRSLAEVSSALEMARSDLAAREQMRIVALNTLEQARIEAARQVRYLSISVPPIAPDRATYPRAAENTAVAFFVFLGLYFMVSLTVSILREQISV